MRYFHYKLWFFPVKNYLCIFLKRRYKQLIQDCENSGITFGIPIYLDKRLDYGTEVELGEVVQSYDSGAKDIICRGLRVFRINDFES